MRSFFFGLAFLLFISYWCHLFVTRDIDPNVSVKVTIDAAPKSNGICECRCCLLNSAVCEPVLRYEFRSHDGFSCHSCTEEFCQKNQTESNQCHWMSKMIPQCYYHEHRRKSSGSSSSFVIVRPILQ